MGLLRLAVEVEMTAGSTSELVAEASWCGTWCVLAEPTPPSDKPSSLITFTSIGTEATVENAEDRKVSTPKSKGAELGGGEADKLMCDGSVARSLTLVDAAPMDALAIGVVSAEEPTLSLLLFLSWKLDGS